MKTNRRRPVAARRKGSKGPGYEFWSRRDSKAYAPPPGRITKTITNRRERRKGRNETRRTGSAG